MRGVSCGYDVTPSILEGQDMKSQAANRINLSFQFHLGALDLSHNFDFHQFARGRYRVLSALAVSLETVCGLHTSNLQMSLEDQREALVFSGFCLGNGKIFRKLGCVWLILIVS